MTVSNEKGSNTLTKSSYIIVSNALNGPVASFSASPASGKAPLSVSFTGQGKGAPTEWKWSFGDGNTSTDKNPVYTFNKSGGLYSVKLTASNEKGSNTLTKSSYIAVAGISNTPVASFSASPPVTGNAPLTVSFTDRSTGHQLHGNGILEMKLTQQKGILCTHTMNQGYILLH